MRCEGRTLLKMKMTMITTHWSWVDDGDHDSLVMGR